MKKRGKVETNPSAEEKIKEAARVVFTKKGYAATKTRDIAEEAGLNLALLNYYFRSKEKLFEIIMAEKLQQLFGFIFPVLTDPKTSLEEKLDLIAVSYIDGLLENPDLPIFILSELKRDPEKFGKNIKLQEKLLQSSFIQQLGEANKEVNPLQFLLAFLGMLIFPFIARPVFQASGVMSEELFRQMMEKRKSLVRDWMKAILK